MTDPRTAPSALRRPRLLSRAARAGAALYRRERDLAALLPGASRLRRAGDIVARLRHLEAECERERRQGAVEYSVTRHVRVLAALVAEAMRAGAGPRRGAA